MENFNDADRDSNNGSEPEEQIDQPTPLNLNKPMDEPDLNMTKNNVGSKGTLNLDSVQDNHPLIGTNGMTPHQMQESERLDYSFIGSQVG